MTTQDHKSIRFGFIGGIAFAILLVIYGLVSYPAVLAISPTLSVIYLALLIILLGNYGWLSLRRTQTTSEDAALALRYGVQAGLLIGLLWVIELWAGNLADPQMPALVLIYEGSIVAVVIATIVAGALASRRTGSIGTGIMVGLWSGMISALITFIALLLITYIFMRTLQSHVQDFQQFLDSGAPDFATFSVSDSIVAATNHLWIGPLIGVVFGALGGLIGRGSVQSPA